MLGFLADMQTVTIEEAAALIANKCCWHEGGQQILLMQLLDAAKDGTLIVRHPHTYLPYRPKEYCEYFERVSMSDLNRYFEAAGTRWRLDKGDETAERLFETGWWNLQQVLAWVYLRESAVVREGASFGMRLIEEATNSPTVCYLSFAQALIEALQTRKLTAYGFKNGEHDRTEIPALQWADPTFLWNPDRVYDSRLGTSRWTALRFKRKDILALWPDPLGSLAMADDHNRTPSERRTGAAIAALKRNKNDRRKKLKLFINDVYTALDKDGYALVDNGGRKPLPVSKVNLRTAFIDRHPEHEIRQATFNDDLPQISVKVNPGRKRLTIQGLRTILAKKNRG